MTTPATNTTSGQTGSVQLTLEAIEATVVRAIRRENEDAKRRDVRRRLSRYPENMTVNQVADYFNCDPDHVRALYDEGRLKGKNIASEGAQKRCLRFQRDDVAAFEEAARLRDFTTQNL